MAALSHVFGKLSPKIMPCTKMLMQHTYCRTQLHVPHAINNSLSTLSRHQQNNGQLDFRLQSARCMSGGKRSFLNQLFDNVKQEFSKNKEMKESLKHFREETEKIEQSESIQQARRKFEHIEAERLKSSAAFKHKFDDIKDKMSEALDDVQKSELGKKSHELAEELSRTVSKAADNVSKQGQQIGQSAAFQNITQGVKAVKQELDDVTLAKARHYMAPETLQKRSDLSGIRREERHVEANPTATGIVMHKDSKWYQNWQSFKDNNQYMHKLFDLKSQYDESDHMMVRATRALTDKFTFLFGGMFSQTEMSEVLTEICKMDPNFNKEAFVSDCEREIIPNILEAMVRGDLEILKDWCYEAAYNTLAHPIKNALQAGYHFRSRILDINNVDVAAAKIMEHGPVLVISFNAQQIMAVLDGSGNLVEGNPDKIVRVFYVWALCRDQEELHPKEAWKLIDISASTSDQWL